MCHASYCRVASIDRPEKYAQRFAENAIDLSVVCYLTEEDLKELGVPLGHGRKMLHAIAELSAAAAVKGCEYAPARWRPLRLSRSRPLRGERLGGADRTAFVAYPPRRRSRGRANAFDFWNDYWRCADGGWRLCR